MSTDNDQAPLKKETESSGPRRSCLGSMIYLAGVIVSALYLFNPGAGVLEILPDNIPLYGNLDEAFFTMLLIACLSYFGISIPGISPRRAKSPENKI